MESPELAVSAIVIDQGRLLMVERGRPPSAGRWSLPGGRVEPDETLEAAAAREVLEETGIAVSVRELVGYVERRDEARHFIIVDFLATPLAGESPMPDPRAGDDAAAAKWVPLAEVGRLRLVHGLGDFLAQHGVL